MRKIIHVDADCFYAAIEMRDNPALRDKAIAVGGDPGRRGVISTCNYAARAFGVRSAMPSKTAVRLCPQLQLLPHRFEAYREASQSMRSIFLRYSEVIEPLSLDEAFIDVSECDQFSGSATRIAEAIRAEVKRVVGITVSAGVAPNKFLAKVASDWRKPDGLFVVAPAEVPAFVSTLPVGKIFGVGKVTAARMHSLGIGTCGDLQQWTELALAEQFGSFGRRLYSLCRGEDDRLVKPHRIRKSLSVEHTYSEDLQGEGNCLAKLPALVAELTDRLGKLSASYRPNKAFVKIKFADFTATTLERAAQSFDETTFQPLLSEALTRGKPAVRLLGVGVRFAQVDSNSTEQLDLFEFPTA